MNELEKVGVKMTVKEVAEILGVDPEAIKKHIRELYPEYMKNGITTYIDESQVTAIKKRMIPTTQVVANVTDIEMMEKAADIMKWLYSKVEEERNARVIAERRNAVLMHVSKLYTATEIAKELGMRSAHELNEVLAENKIQFKQNDTWVPYAEYSELGYFSIKQTVLDSGKIVYDRKITQDGRAFIIELVGNSK